MPAALFVVGCLWALPTTLLGFALALGGLCRPYAVRDGAVWFRVATRWSPWAWWAKRFAAITFGGCVITAGEPDESVIRHELRHFAQARLLGPLFLPVYLALSLWAFLRGRDAYFDNALERDARSAE